MPRYIVWLPKEHAEKLNAIAGTQRRKPNDQAALMIERSLKRARITETANTKEVPVR
jgi:hypothetical protein